MKRRDLVKLLSQAGFKLERDDGDHSIYKNQAAAPFRFQGTGN